MKFLLCLLPVIVQARITVDIRASQTMTQSDLALTGSSHNIITAQDRKNFNLDETKLRNAVSKLTGNKRIPDNVYLTSPTPWNDLYKTYGWKEVTAILKPIRARVINVKKENVTLNKKEAVNKGTEPIVERVTMSAKFEDTVTSDWGHAMPFEADIDYNVHLKGIGNVTRFNLTSSWGNGLKDAVIGHDGPVTVDVHLQPKTSATVFANATRVTLEVEVKYVAILDGYVATNYEERFNGHHFWAYDIASVMKGGSWAQNVTASELMAIEFYDDLKYIVHDIK